MRRLLSLLLVLVMIPVPCFAEDTPTDEAEVTVETATESFDNGYDITIPADWTLEDLMGWFIETYGLTENNFAISIYLPESGDRYAFNETRQMFAASTYKLPLNMYYYERQAEGVYSDDTIIGGAPLSTCHYQSIVWSNNELSQAMIYYLGSFYQYKYLLLEAYGGMSVGELDANYWGDNYYCTKYMCNVLTYLYEHRDSFTELLGYMEEAMPGQYLKTYAGETEIAHKYGVFFDPLMQNDVGILFADEPVLVAIYTQGYSGRGTAGEGLIGRIGRALINYQNQRVALARIAAEEEARRQAEAEAEEAARREQEAAEQAARESEAAARAQEEAARESERIASEEAAKESLAQAELEAAAAQQQARKRMAWILVLSAVGLAVLLAGLKLFLRQKKKVKTK